MYNIQLYRILPLPAHEVLKRTTAKIKEEKNIKH